jgi:hypothetical protein
MIALRKSLYIYISALILIVLVFFSFNQNLFNLFTSKKVSNQNSVLGNNFTEKPKMIDTVKQSTDNRINSREHQSIKNETKEDDLVIKFDRLIEVDGQIDSANAEFKILITKYDQDLSNKGAMGELSAALLESDEYRVSMMEKFKLERSLEELK